MKKILLSLPDELLASFDAQAEKMNVSRSLLARQAMAQFLDAAHKMESEMRLERGYREMAAINREYAAMAQELDEKTFRAYEAALTEDESDGDKERRNI